MTTYIEVSGAYGRDYTSAKAAKADWAAGKDFAIQTIGNRGYINKADADRAGVKVMIRYARMTKVVQA
jgi:hypothetical protein